MPKEPNWFYNWVIKRKHYLNDLGCNYAHVRLLAWAAYRKGKRDAEAIGENDRLTAKNTAQAEELEILRNKHRADAHQINLMVRLHDKLTDQIKSSQERVGELEKAFFNAQAGMINLSCGCQFVMEKAFEQALKPLSKKQKGVPSNED